jgi:hypothetical protein
MVGRYYKDNMTGQRCRVDQLVPKLDKHRVRQGHTVLITFDGANYQDSMDAQEFEAAFTPEPTGDDRAVEILKDVKLGAVQPIPTRTGEAVERLMVGKIYTHPNYRERFRVDDVLPTVDGMNVGPGKTVVYHSLKECQKYAMDLDLFNKSFFPELTEQEMAKAWYDAKQLTHTHRNQFDAAVFEISGITFAITAPMAFSKKIAGVSTEVAYEVFAQELVRRWNRG